MHPLPGYDLSPLIENQNEDAEVNQKIDNIQKLNSNDDKPKNTAVDLDEANSQSITITKSGKESNKKEIDFELKDNEESDDEKYDGPIPPWIR